MKIPWEIKYLPAPWRWFGEDGLIDFHTRTNTEITAWIVQSGLLGPLMCLGYRPEEEPRPYRLYYFRLGRASRSWRKYENPL